MNPLSVCSCVCIPVAIYIQVFVLLFSPDITTWPYPPYSSIFRYRAKINRINAYACHVRACVCVRMYVHAHICVSAHVCICACMCVRLDTLRSHDNEIRQIDERA